MARASAADAAETERRILDFAVEHFRESGYHSASVEAIATAAGVTRGAVYHHYRSKPGLFRAVVERLQADVATAVVRAASDTDPRVALRLGSHAFLDAITADARARILLLDAPSVLGWAEWRRADADASVVHLREAITMAGVEEQLGAALTPVLSGAMNEAALWLSERPGDTDARRAVHESLDLLLDAVLPT